MKAKAKRGSRILAAVHETARDLHQGGAMSDVRMAQFDSMCLAPSPRFSRSRILALRRRHGISQELLASMLNTRPATVRQWEKGETQPRGASLRLLEILDRKGPGVLVRE